VQHIKPFRIRNSRGRQERFFFKFRICPELDIVLTGQAEDNVLCVLHTTLLSGSLLCAEEFIPFFSDSVASCFCILVFNSVHKQA
jgi:hypothetical protein